VSEEFRLGVLTKGIIVPELGVARLEVVHRRLSVVVAAGIP